MRMIPLSFGFHHDLFLMIQLQSPFRKDFTSARHLPIDSQLITTIWNLWARNSTDVISVDIYWFTEGSWGHGKIYRPVLPRLLPMDSSTGQFLLSGQLFSSLGPQSIFRSFTPATPHPPPLAYFPLLLLKHQWLLVFFIFLCVICFLKLPLNSLFDSFLSASCEKHFVFITRQHLFCPSWLSLYSLPELAQ